MSPGVVCVAAEGRRAVHAASAACIRPATSALAAAGKNESEEKRELIFKEDGQGASRCNPALLRASEAARSGAKLALCAPAQSTRR